MQPAPLAVLARTARAGLLAASAALFMLGALPATAPAATFEIDSTRDEADADPGDGLCATESGTCTLRAAIEEANALPGRDEILIPNGTFRLTAGTLILTDDVDIVGGGMDRSNWQGAKAVRILAVAPSVEATIRGVTLRNGGVEDGAGIHNAGRLELHNVKFTRQRSDEGSGGALYNASGAHAELHDVVMLGNAARLGGAIYNAGHLELSDVLVRSNKHMIDGGGAGLMNVGEVTITRSTFMRNQARAGKGGGAILNRGIVEIDNSTLSRNRARLSAGGAIRTDPSSVTTLRNVTVVRNQARFVSGGLANFGTTAVHNTIISENFNNRVRHINCGGDVAVLSLGYNLDSGAVCSFTASGDIANARARLRGEHRNGGLTPSRALLPKSPAIDAGDPTLCPAYDQRGMPRPVDASGLGTARCDIGSFELHP